MISIVILLLNNSVYAKITQVSSVSGVSCSGSESSKYCSDGSSGWDSILKIVGGIADVGLTASTASLANLITILGGILLVLMETLFVTSGIVTSWSAFPMPDTILFNRLAFLDPNFLNPASNSLISGFVNVVKNTFESFRVIAIAIFTVSAMIIGIKLAISTIASEKAKYKQAIYQWITGIVLLLVLKYIIAAIFIINENIVQMAYNAAGNVTFQVSLLNIIPGNAITSGIKAIVGKFVDTNKILSISVPGYFGFYLKYFLQGWGGNLLSSIIAFIVMGQTITLLIAYIKRLVICLMLGVTSPLIIAADSVKKAAGQQSNIFNNWFKQFALAVLMQSFHAIMLLIILKILSGFSSRR